MSKCNNRTHSLEGAEVGWLHCLRCGIRISVLALKKCKHYKDIADLIRTAEREQHWKSTVAQRSTSS